MTYEEAEQIAIARGALKPQTIGERMAAGFNAYNNRGAFANTPRAQSRLQAWTQFILDGGDPNQLGR